MKERQKNIIIHLDITVKGRVQGVGFRYSAQNMARRFGICGMVRNMSSGAVYIEIEGNKISTDLMLDWCKQGPGTGRVDEIIVNEGSIKGFMDFKVV